MPISEYTGMRGVKNAMVACVSGPEVEKIVHHPKYPNCPRALIISVALIGLMVASACGPTYDSSRIRDPQGDLITNRRAKAPDGKTHALSGKASWYGERFQGRPTASGEPFDMYRFTAAHKTLPFHTIVRVTEPDSNRTVVVRINDRGPFSPGRVIDLSYGAAVDIGLIGPGVMPVELEVLQWGDGSRVRADK